MENLKSILARANAEGWATGHFNGSELDQLRAIVEACKELGAPAIIGTSEGERKHLGIKAAAALRNVLRDEYGIPVFLNADHTFSVEKAKEAIDAGYDSIHIDLSKKPFEENLSQTKEVVEYAKAKNPEISVEGEVGYLVTESSRIYKEKIEIPKESLTKPDEAARFVEETNVDRFAPAVGNLHGIAANEPRLDIELIKELRARLPKEITIVLHGGSGITNGDMRRAVEAGIANIHVNTELRIAYSKGLREDPDQISMYKIDKKAFEYMKDVVKEKLQLFGSAHKV